MHSGRNYAPKDYLAFGVSLLLAFGVWLIHNFSLDYSGLVQKSVIARCELYGHSNVSSNVSDVVARCNISGYEIVSNRIWKKRRNTVVDISPEDLKHSEGDLYYLTREDIAKYFHDVFGDKSALEYIVTDTAFFRFPAENYKKVPVHPVMSVTFRPQYMPEGELKLFPDSVLVYGNGEVLDDIMSVNTELIGFQDVAASLFGEVPLESIPGLRMSDGAVRYELTVHRYVEQEFTVDVVPVNVPPSVSAQVFPGSATVRVKSVFPGLGNYPDIAVQVDFNDFEASVNGKCLGTVSGLPSDVLDCILAPEVFDCVIRAKE